MDKHQREFFPLLSALVDGEVDANVRHQLQEHVRTCTQCQEVLLDFRKIREIAFSTKSYPVDPYYMARIKAALGDATVDVRSAPEIVAKLLLPLLVVLVTTMIVLFSRPWDEKSALADDYLYFGGRRTFAEQQLLSHSDPFSQEEVLLLSLSYQGGEEPNGR